MTRRRRSFPRGPVELGWALASLVLGCNLLTGVDDLVIDGGWGHGEGQGGYAGAVEGSSAGAAPENGGGGTPLPPAGDDGGTSGLGAGGETESGGGGTGGSGAGGAEGAGGAGTGGEAPGDGGTSGGGTSGGGGGSGGDSAGGGTSSGGTSSGGTSSGGSGAGGSGGSGSGGSGSGGSGSGGEQGNPCECTGGKVCEKKKCVCPDDELDCDGTCIEGACCPGEVLGSCSRCGVLVCRDDAEGTECTEQGVCEAGNTCGLLGIGKWDDGVTDCNVCGLLQEAYCNDSCEPDCRVVLGL